MSGDLEIMNPSVSTFDSVAGAPGARPGGRMGDGGDDGVDAWC